LAGSQRTALSASYSASVRAPWLRRTSSSWRSSLRLITKHQVSEKPFSHYCSVVICEELRIWNGELPRYPPHNIYSTRIKLPSDAQEPSVSRVCTGGAAGSREQRVRAGETPLADEHLVGADTGSLRITELRVRASLATGEAVGVVSDRAGGIYGEVVLPVGYPIAVRVQVTTGGIGRVTEVLFRQIFREAPRQRGEHTDDYQAGETRGHP